MGNFCKGLVFGMLAGATIGAVIVAKNKNLSQKIKEGYDFATKKLTKAKDSIEEKIQKCSEQNNEQKTETPQNNFDTNKNLKN